jgi:hypothetical protein
VEAIQTEALDQQIARLEAELAQLKAQGTRQRDRKPKPLDGIRILDMSRFIFGPFCAQMLATWGLMSSSWSPCGAILPAPLATCGSPVISVRRFWLATAIDMLCAPVYDYAELFADPHARDFTSAGIR